MNLFCAFPVHERLMQHFKEFISLFFITRSAYKM